MSTAGFSVESARLAAAGRLPARHFEEFQRLSKTLVYGPAFQLVFVDCAPDADRRLLVHELCEVGRSAGLESTTLRLHGRIADVGALEQLLIRRARTAQILHLINADRWFDASRWDAFNLLRERLARDAHVRLVFWLDARSLGDAARHAVDLWAWRAGVYSFKGDSASAADGWLTRAQEQREQTSLGADISHRERWKRVAELRSLLQDEARVPHALRGALIRELGEHLYELAEPSVETHLRDVQIPFFQEEGDSLSLLGSQGLLAFVLRRQGRYAEALKLYEEVILPACDHERLQGMKPSYLRSMAGVLKVMGLSDRALKVLRDEVVPLREREGDPVRAADAWGDVAELLAAQGLRTEALRIVEQQQLPLYEREQDVLRVAETQEFIAKQLQGEGKLESAEQVLREHVIAPYERMHEERRLADAYGKLAGILEAQNRLDEALALLREKELPVYERLGDARAVLLSWAGIAHVLNIRGQPEDRAEVLRLLNMAYHEATARGLRDAKMIDDMHRSIFGEPPGEAA